ncbi:hypothetical protein KC343_g5064 [Hortaea werneckii]|nr:hypothetical protein KC323_g4747 [Hortaea werneckii]KAI6868717.1 hypothetical protein KC338_g3823 [Hortaea werneckii]KAI7352887.1 hypothetical protein KC320_g4256 [Hortaea werneckii]KAI7629716.1 hypothetical protein KC343_g5064 [Hortaea werneckii]KAI7674091.1 hypothetical protein KC319_g4899 [Hortaea werneckii]
MGRPPGALRRDYDDLGRGHYYEDWELRDYDAAAGRRQASAGSGRLEELMDSEDEGVMLDAQGYYAWRDGRHARGPDELYYTGYDLGQDRPRRRMTYDYQQAHNGFDPLVDETYGRRGSGQRISSREQALADGALERIAKARQKGKTNINLSVEEMEALERRRGVSQLPEPPPPVPASMPHPTPPTTPGKTPKGSSSSKSGSRSNSSTNLTGQKLKSKKTSLFGGSSSNQASSPSPAKSNSKAKVNRRPSTSDHHAGPPPSFLGGGNAGPPGIMVPGPDGKPMFAPLVNYPNLPTASPEYSRAGGSRSSSKHSRREPTPPERLGGGVAGGAAGYYYPTNAGGRSESSGSNRSFSDMGPGAASGDFGWYPSPSRQRSGSAATPHHYPYTSPRPSTGASMPGYDDEYAGSPSSPSMPAAHHSPHHPPRRPVPPPSSSGYNVQYSPLLRRVPPLAAGGSGAPSAGPAGRRSMGTPGTSGLNYELERTSSGPSSDEDDHQGVQVNIAPEAGGGYAGYRVSGRSGVGGSGTAAAAAAAASPAQMASSGGNQGRKRNKGGRR